MNLTLGVSARERESMAPAIFPSPFTSPYAGPEELTGEEKAELQKKYRSRQ
jgi:hypothetical protein